MKNFFETLSNIWKIKELRDRILLTLALLAVYRLGSFIPLPGVDEMKLIGLNEAASNNGLLGLLNSFTGGAFAHAAILGLGVMPYISASIVVQLMAFAVPALQKLQKDGESGRKQLTQITRWLTIAIAAVQGFSYIVAIDSQYHIVAQGISMPAFYVCSVVLLVTGTMFTMWLGERITEKGVGQGVSLIITVGIIARLPLSLGQEFSNKFMGGGAGGMIMLLFEIVIWLAVIMFTLFLVRGVRKIPVQYAKAVASAGQGGRQIGVGKRQYIPMKVYTANVMPIIFAQAVMFLPGLIGGMFSESVKMAFNDMFGLWYNIVLAALIIAFTYLYTAIAVKTNDMADDLKRNGGFIPGVKPGAPTANLLDRILSLLTLPGALALAFIAILPTFAKLAGVEPSFAMFFGGTSLLIMVGVVIDTIQQVNSYLLNRHYDGLMKTGKIKK
ncbi:MAG: preprotein translocase subunit SecY [Flavobacteriales bacterium]|nr:preprotein translocase subunit SecY [Flavobacteriales bacterium]PWM09782.1 MAG: preprotein translocase subunit SecY [Flavobacteriales bacterium]